MAALANLGNTIPTGKSPTLTEEEAALLRKKAEERYIEIQLKRGLKEFKIKGEKIIALNEKNAIKKYNKQLKI